MSLTKQDLASIKAIVTEVVETSETRITTTSNEAFAAVETRLDSVEQRLTNIESDVAQTRIDITTVNNRLRNIEASVGDLRATDDGIVDALARKQILSESEAHDLRHRKPVRHAAERVNEFETPVLSI
jgi:septal ring factor EnvC (AmiA/AmiB activator)